MPFRDIKIVSLDEESTQMPEAGSDLFDVALTLSDSPPSEWVQIFDDKWRTEFYMMKRRAWVQGS